jgi:small GTP-binding protein
MLQKKVCMLGAFAVGKTSLVSRFVKSIFSKKYHTTIGVKIYKKELRVDAQPLTLILWDLAGEDEFLQVRMAYMRGAAGYLLVVDGTRRDTLDTALQLQARVEASVGKLPFVLVCNKSDLGAGWEISEEMLTSFKEKGWAVIATSARSGVGVEEAFLALAKQMVEA